jgi:hypothetical protein
MRNAFAIVTSVLLAPGVAPAADPVYKDLRRPGSKSSYAIGFVARGGVPGHAFVVFCREDDLKKASVVEAFGFYPTNGVKAALGPVPGKIVDEYREKTGVWKAGTHLVAFVDRDAYVKAEAIMKKWSEKKTYQMLEADCVTFQAAVARAIGLKTPPRDEALRPVTFSELMSNLNR